MKRMKIKEWLDCEKKITRRELVKACLISAFPLGLGYVVVLFILQRSHKEGGEWKKR